MAKKNTETEKSERGTVLRMTKDFKLVEIQKPTATASTARLPTWTAPKM